MGKEKLIPILALVVILVGGFSAIYVHATQVNKDTITINEEEYTIDQIFYMSDSRTINTSDGEKSGIALDDLMFKVGVGCPGCHEYTIKAKDGYQKTVTWDFIKNGILTEDGRTFFSEGPRAYWVRDVVEIEVK